MPVQSIETVGLWRDRSRRRVETLKVFGGALAAGLTLFAAIKISDAGASAGLPGWIGALFQTLVFLSAFCWFRCYGNAQLDVDLLNRYLATSEGGNWGQGDPPLKLATSLSEAELVLKVQETELKKPWPSRGEGFFNTMVVLGGLAALLLLIYIWLPKNVSEAEPGPKPPTAPQTVPTSVGVLISVHFEHDRALVSGEAARRLSRLAVSVAPRLAECLKIEGHADIDGPNEYNVQLSRMRAQSVSNIFTDNGVSSQRIEIVPYGNTRPSEPGRSERAKAENRRVDVLVEECK